MLSQMARFHAFLWLNNILLYIYCIFFIHPSTDGHTGCIRILVTVNNHAMKLGVQTSMFIATLFTIAKAWKQPKCPSAEEWIKKRWCIYSMDCYSATKRKEPGSLLLLMRAFILWDVSFLFLLSPFASLSSPWFVLSVSLSHKVHAFFILVMTLRTWFLKFTSVS